MQIQFRVWQAYRTAIGALLLLCLLASCAQASSLGCQKSLGGGQEVQSVQETADGGYAVAGNAQSNDSLVSNNSVGNDHSGNINCTITAHDVVCPSTSNLASTAESGAAYSWSITNGMILEGSHARMIKFGAGASGTIRLTVDVSKNGSNASCFKDIPIALPNCSWTSNAPVFNGTPVQFTAPAGMDGYYWDFGDGSEPIKGLCNSSHLYPRPGTYNVSLTVTSCGSSEKCRGSVFVAIIPVWTSNAPVCNGTPVQFKGPAGMDSYAWDFGDGQRGSAQSPSHLYSAPGTYNANLTATKSGVSKSCHWPVEVRRPTRAYWCYLDWQKCLGGSGSDVAESIQQTTYGGYIVAGYTKSDNGDVKGWQGGRDMWIVNLSPSGSIVWQTPFGGSAWDVAYSILQARDGGYLVAGYTRSVDGDLRDRKPHWYDKSRDCEDPLILKLNRNGLVIGHKWVDTNDAADDRAYSVQEIGDNEFVVAGYTQAPNYEDYKHHLYINHDSACTEDYLVLKLEKGERSEWCFMRIKDAALLGGSQPDYGQSIQKTADGGFIVAGWTNSKDGDVTGYHGKGDIWVVKLKKNFDIEWEKCLGGWSFDAAYWIRQTADKGYIVAGVTESNNGDVKGNHGGKDFWVVKLNTKGKKEWQKCLGGSKDDIAYSVQQTTDGGYIVAGYTESNNGDVKGNHGDKDFWVVKLDSSGNLVWQKCLGGSEDDEAHSIQQTADGGYIIAGYTESNNGNVSGHHKEKDFWVVKLGEINCTVAALDVVCPGSTGNVASVGESGAVYAWSITNGTITSPSDGQSITFTAGESGTVRLAVRVTVTSLHKNCYYDESYKDIKIRSIDCRWTFNAPALSETPVQFTGPDEMDFYVWVFGDGEGSNSKDPVHIYRAPGNYNVSLKVVSCGSSKKCAKIVQVLYRPDCSWTSNAPVCNGTPVQFTGPAGTYPYLLWEFGDGTSSSAQNPAHLYSGPGSYAVNLTVAKGDKKRTCAGSIEVKLQPGCSWSSNAPVCNGTAVQFTGPDGVDAYYWEFGDGQSSPAKDPVHLYSAPARYTVNLKATIGGCTRSCPGTVLVNPVMLDCSWTSNSPVCDGTPVQFFGPPGIVSRVWTFGDGSTSYEKDPKHLYPGPGDYWVVLYMASSCCSSVKFCEGGVKVKPEGECNWTSNATVPGEAAEELAPTMETGPPKGSPTAARQARERTGSASTQDSLTDFGAPSRPP